MARFGRSTPPSTRLRAPIRPDGPPPHVYALGAAGEQSAGRPVNRATGEVRVAGEQTVALAAGRTHVRTAGVSTEQDAGRAFAGRAHRRDLGRAGETSTGNAVRRGHRRDTGRSVEYSSARSVLGDRPNVTPEAWAAAIESDDRTPIMRLQADWARTGQFDHAKSDLTDLVKTVTVDRSLATTLPANVGIVEGSSAASLTAELGGEWPDGATPTQAFAPYRTDAAFWAKPVIGTPVTLDTGFVTEQGAKTERRFTGSVRRVASKSKDRQVTLDALDGANKLRAPINLPARGLDSMLLARYGPARYFSRINSQWLIDYILRCNGYFTSGPLHPQAIIAATMHGSSIPERGFGGVPQEYATGSPQTTQPWVNDTHPYGMLYPNPLAPAMTSNWYANTPVPVTSGSGFGFSFWSQMPATGATKSDKTLFDIQLGGGVSVAIKNVASFDGSLAVFPYINGFGYQHAIGQLHASNQGGTWVYWGVHFRFTDTGYLGSFRIWQPELGYRNAFDATDIQTWPNGRPTGAASDRPLITYTANVPFTNFQFWVASAPPAVWPGLDWPCRGSIDAGLGEWTGIPTIAGEDSWTLLKEVVGAEFGSVGFTPSGDFFFRARTTQAAAAVSREQITAGRSLADLATTTDEASVRNVVTGTSKSFLIRDWEDVYTSTDPAALDCGPGVTDFFLPVPDDVCGQPFRPLYIVYNNDDWGNSDEYVSRDIARCAIVLSADPKTYVPSTANIKIGVYIFRPGVVRLTIYNNSTYSIRFATPSKVDSNGVTTEGQPAFKIPGRRLLPADNDPITISDSGSIVDYGERSYDLGGQSRWRQHPESVAAVASSVLSSLGRPAPVLEDVEVPHDPRRDLFSPVAVSDPEGLGTVLGTITGIKTTYSASGAVDSLTVRPIGPPGLGVMDDADLGQVGATLVFGA